MSIGDLIGKFGRLTANNELTPEQQGTISDFLKVVPSASPEVALRFLTKWNWCLEGAVQDFYTGGQNTPSYGVTFINKGDEVERVANGSRFECAYKIVNTGDLKWPEGTTLEFVSGERLNGTYFEIPPLEPHEQAYLELNFKAPMTLGEHTSTWQLMTEDRIPLGQPLTINIFVKEQWMYNPKHQESQTKVDALQNPFSSSTLNNPWF
eukprot:TRINITY_DN46_c1_g1_i1.p1 TRINITY_DN46_c1_g1~~TRINITY_DN46_c1_g1_i1.p1  ORF type:complete len:208 (-),score=30.34 TRINITY_DN46_c1_g1_i1:599-1222(-)